MIDELAGADAVLDWASAGVAASAKIAAAPNKSLFMIITPRLKDGNLNCGAP